jgi:RHS repeat-associated protein
LNTAQDAITPVSHSESWNFDKTGNWSQYTKNGVIETRDHNAANELQGIATHDANGNMVLIPGLKGKYDARNRLVEVRDSNDNLIAQYEYNGLNQRIKKTVNNVETKSFFNENWQEIESITNNQVTNYIWGLRYIDDLVLREKGEERLYSFADPNWNVVAICDDSGNVQERYTYDAFGKRNVFDANFTVRTVTNFNWNRAFTGQVLDIETGLMLYRNRFYHAGLGIFIIRDIKKSERYNLYRYTNNSPMIYVDILGYNESQPINERRKECCDKKKKMLSNSINKDAAGVTICCGKDIVSCILTDDDYFDARNITNPKIQVIFNICTQVHESQHVFDITSARCPSCPESDTSVSNPSGNSDPERFTELECRAYKMSVLCFQTIGILCGDDKDCLEQLNTIIAEETTTKNNFCSGKNPYDPTLAAIP